MNGRLRAFKSTCRGFTLVECMIAVLIVAIVMSASLSFLAFLRNHNAIEQERARAHQVVSEEMERVRLELFSRIKTNSTTDVWNNGTPNDTTDDTVGQLTVTMTDPATGAVLNAAPVPAQAVAVEVTLTWSPRGRLSNNILRETVMTYVVP